jgi:putative ABC transport system permease protein
VSGIYPFPDPFENKHLVILPLRPAQRLVHMPERATTLAVALQQNASLEQTLAALRTRTAGSDPQVELHPWYEVSPYFRDIIKLEGDLMRAVIFIIFALVVAGVVNTMLMSVLERTREIGTLMAMGFRRRRILSLFLVEAVLLTLLASLLGVALGGLVIFWVGQSGVAFDLPGAGVIRVFPKFNVVYVGWSVAAALAGGLVGGLIPARRASRMRPIEALRNA